MNSARTTPTADSVRALMPQLQRELSELVAIPCVSASGYPEETHADLLKARDFIVELLRDAGVEQIESLELPETAPIIMGEIPAPDGAPTVLLYGHYDVVPAGEESKWESPPFEATERDGAIYGRGSADSKSNILVHVGALRAWEGRPPVGVKIVIEGQEEIGSAFTTFPPSKPELFAADAMVIADMGSLRPGVPTLTIALRGTASVIVEVRTLAGPKHSGQFGGVAPDALVVLLHALASLHDERGDVAVDGLRREEWTGATYSDDEFRELAEVAEGLPFFGTGGLGERVWSGPALTVTGVDAQPVDQALNAVVPYARAKLNLRIHPEQDPDGGAGRAREASRSAAAVRDLARGDAGRDREGIRRGHVRPGLRRGARRLRDGLGQRAVVRRDRRLDPARQRAPGGGPGRGDPAAGHDRRLRQHPRAERARPDRRVREGGGRRDRALRAARRDLPEDGGIVTTAPEAAPAREPIMQRILGAIERGGNKMPNPAILFVWLCVIVIVLSALLAWADIKVTYQVVEPPPISVEETVPGGSTQPSGGLPDASVQEGEYTVREETASIQSLLSADGIRFLFTSFVASFRNFAAVAIILVVMIGVGLAEAAGLIGALIRKLVKVSSEAMLTPILVFIGVLSSIASDAGYLVLIPLGAAAFKSVGRNPLAGMAAAFAGVAAGFGVNFLITPLDGVLTEITNDASALADPEQSIDLAANLYFGIASTILVTIVLTLVSVYIVERSLGKHDPALESGDESLDADKGPEVSPEAEAKGLRYALIATVAVLVGIGLLTVFPDAPLRDPVTGDIIGDSPFMDSLILIITIIFFAAGLAYGRGAGTIRTSDEVLASITKSWAGLASLLFLFLLIAQFIAYFNFSNMAQVAAVKLGDWLEEANIGVVWLLIGFVLVTMLVDLIMPAAIAKWAILAPIFIPLFLRLDVAPQTVLAAYRVGDSPFNVVTPLMAYFPLIIIFAQRYRRDAGIGTVVAMMLPYVLVLSIIWTLFFVGWYLLGIPLGPGAPVHND